MSRLSDLSASPMIREFAQGAAQTAIQPIADFLAPVVNVGRSVGRYKVYDQKNRFKIPNTHRGLTGDATQVTFSASDATYNCEPHALDFPVDVLEQDESADLENMLQEGAQMIAEVGALDHEKTVIDLALATISSSSTLTWSGSTPSDPVGDIDTDILSVIKAAAYGSAMDVGVLFGANAWRLFKNNTYVKGRFVQGNKSTPSAVAVPSVENVGQLFIGNPESRVSFMVADTTQEGLAASLAFLLDLTILVFARKPNPTRRDPSFMKTFRLANRWMQPGTYMRDDGRVEVAKFDWSEAVVVTNSGACLRRTIA